MRKKPQKWNSHQCNAFAVSNCCEKAPTKVPITILPHASLPVCCQRGRAQRRGRRRRRSRSHPRHRWCHSCWAPAHWAGSGGLAQGKTEAASAQHCLAVTEPSPKRGCHSQQEKSSSNVRIYTDVKWNTDFITGTFLKPCCKHEAPLLSVLFSSAMYFCVFQSCPLSFMACILSVLATTSALPQAAAAADRTQD